MIGKRIGWKWFATGLLVTASYVLAAKVGLTFAFIGKAVSPVWPPAGVALASLLILGISYWPFIFLGGVCTVFCVQAPLAVMLPIASEIALEASLGAFLIRKTTGTSNPFESGKNVFWFLGTALFTSALGGVLGAITLISTHVASTLFSMAAYTWSLGDIAGIIILTPLIVSFVSVKEKPFSGRQRREFAVIFLLLIGANAAIFTSLEPEWAHEVPSLLLIVPSLLWISIRFGIRGSSLASFILYAFSTYGTSRGYGPFVRPSPHQSLIFVQLFIIAVSLSSLIISAVMTEKDRIFQKLTESEEKLKGIFNHSFQHIGLLSPEGRVISASQSSLDFVNTTVEEVVGKLYWETIYWQIFENPLDRDRVLQAILKACQGQFMRMEIPLLNHVGERKIFDVSFKPMFNNQGKIEYIIPEARDISDLKASQEEVQQQATLLNAIVEGTTDAMYAKDLEGRYLLINSAGANFLGKEIRDIIGKTDREVFVEESGIKIMERDRKVLESGRNETYEEICTSQTGSRHYLVNKGPIYDNQGQVIGLVGVSKDISERKKMENDLRRSNIELEHFAYVASHDLQEPLRMVIAHLQLLERSMGDDLSPDSRDFMNFAIDGARRMRDLIHDLLTYSRVARREISFQAVDCNTVISRVLFGMKDSIQESGAAIVRLPLPSLLCDGERFAQLFQNLLGNALKYRRTEVMPKIEIGAEPCDEGWRFWVRDNGIGIESEFRDRIFSMFQRLHSREQYPGTGIGLAICKKVVEQHGGRLWVESVPGEGSTFYFIVPNRVVASPPSATQAGAEVFA